MRTDEDGSRQTASWPGSRAVRRRPLRSIAEHRRGRVLLHNLTTGTRTGLALTVSFFSAASGWRSGNVEGDLAASRGGARRLWIAVPKSSQCTALSIIAQRNGLRRERREVTRISMTLTFNCAAKKARCREEVAAGSIQKRRGRRCAAFHVGIASGRNRWPTCNHTESRIYCNAQFPCCTASDAAQCTRHGDRILHWREHRELYPHSRWINTATARGGRRRGTKPLQTTCNLLTRDGSTGKGLCTS